MTLYVALLRAVNVGGTGKLPMADLREMAQALGFENPRTYIASGNLVFESALDETHVKAALEQRLEAYAGKPLGVMVRTGAAMAQVLADNPFSARPPEKTAVLFLDTAPPNDALATISHQTNEEVTLGAREIYVHYPDGMGRSKLKIPAARNGTARNINTVAKLARMARTGVIRDVLPIDPERTVS